MHSECKKDNFNSCSGTGEQESNIYALRDFEECNPKNHHGWECSKCNCNGYKIPFKNYEIKKVSEITEDEIGSWYNYRITNRMVGKYSNWS